MKVCFLSDPGNADGSVGGAELTMREFAAAAPEPLVKLKYADTVVVGNCTSYGPDLISLIEGKRVVWFHHDLSPHILPGLKRWLDANATHMFCSPLQQEAYGLDGELVPPAIDLDRFRTSTNGNRQGAVSVGSWQNAQKGQQSLLEWAQQNGGMDVYGTGPFAPATPPLDFKGALEPADVADTLAHYQTFVHLPWAIEPFGRCVVEAWASGCALVTNKLVGANWWITERPEGLENAAQRFWEVVRDS